MTRTFRDTPPALPAPNARLAAVWEMSHILPKKEWHVYNESNREIVRHDEERVRIEGEKLEAKAAQASREARLSILRARSSSNTDVPQTSTREEAGGKGHASLFEEAQQDQRDLTPTEKEIEGRKKREAAYLVRVKGAADPWYRQAKRPKGELKDYEEKRQRREDPLGSCYRRPGASKSEPLCKRSVDELRRERLEREDRERERERVLLEGHDSSAVRYNSQFNPHISSGRHGRHKDSSS